MADEAISFKIEKHIGTIRTTETGWSKELNIVSWNGSAPKYDIREWSPDHERMTRGITLFPDEMKNLAAVLKDRDLSMDFPEKKGKDWER